MKKNISNLQSTKAKDVETKVVDLHTLQRWINIPQVAFLKWYKSVDFKDAAIVIYVLRFYKSENEKINALKVNGKPWICLKTLSQSMPLLNFGYRQLRRRLDHLVAIKLLDREFYIGGDGRKRTYLKPTKTFLLKLEEARTENNSSHTDDDD